jgi:prolyl oligopeptidase
MADWFKAFTEKQTSGNERSPSPTRRALLWNTVIGGVLTPYIQHAQERTAAAKEDAGTPVSDPFRWLEDGGSPEVRKWMDTQVAKTNDVIAQAPARPWLRQRLGELLRVEDVQVPVPRGGRLFYTKKDPSKDKALLCMREGGVERILVDSNTWTKTDILGQWIPSPNGNLVALSQRPNNADEATWRILDVESGELLPHDVFTGQPLADPAWLPDGSAFFYTYCPPTDSGLKVTQQTASADIRRHRVGTQPDTDQKVRDATGDAKAIQAPWVSPNGEHLIVGVFYGASRSELYWKRASAGEEFIRLDLGVSNSMPIGSSGNFVYVQTDFDAPQQRVVRLDVSNRAQIRIEEVITEQPQMRLAEAVIIGSHLVLNYLRDAASELFVCDLTGSNRKPLPLPPFGALGLLSGDPKGSDLFVRYSNLATPPRVLRFDVDKHTATTFAETRGAAPKTELKTKRVFCRSKDGTKVPLFIVHRADRRKNGPFPTWLTGYGGFDSSVTPVYRSNLVPFVEAGGTVVLAGLRGGGEYGKAWHEAGTLERKQNTFDDFIAAARFLIAERYTSRSKLAISGSSNGGLLVTAVLNQAPDLFGIVVPVVPLTDMVRYTELDRFAPFWTAEYGDPRQPEQLRFLLKYSPYHNIRNAKRYPPVLLMSAEQDTRVNPAHARKFVAALQAAGAPQALLYVQPNASHGGAGRVEAQIDLMADQLAFVMQKLGMEAPA